PDSGSLPPRGSPETKPRKRRARRGFSILSSSDAVGWSQPSPVGTRPAYEFFVTATSNDRHSFSHLVVSLLIVEEHAAQSVFTFPSTCSKTILTFTASFPKSKPFWSTSFLKSQRSNTLTMSQLRDSSLSLSRKAS